MRLTSLCLLVLVLPTWADFPKPENLPKQTGLPDLLKTMDGMSITTTEQWETIRKPELRKLFQHYMYGTLPTNLPFTSKVLHEDKQAYGGKATLKEIELAFTGTDFRFRLLVVMPHSKAPVPIFVGPNFTGNHSVVDDPKVQISSAWSRGNNPTVVENRLTEQGRGKNKDTWNIDLIIESGFAVATYYYCEIDPDNKDLRAGVRNILPKNYPTATIACWAWALSRCVDVVTKMPEIDAKKVVSVGHSRLGKTAILAAAMDERIAIAMPHQAGCGGTAPSRSTVGESVERINTSFPHWFNDQFKLFNKDTARLPFDQHGLVALCAPRPVLFTNAEEDSWANPRGQFEVLQAANPVYLLYGKEGISTKEFPPNNQLVDSTLGYFIRPGKHSMIRPDWEVFIAFAKKHFQK